MSGFGLVVDFGVRHLRARKALARGVLVVVMGLWERRMGCENRSDEP